MLAKTPTVIAKVRKSLFITSLPVQFILSPYISKQKKSIKLYLKSNKRKDITMVFERDVFF